MSNVRREKMHILLSRGLAINNIRVVAFALVVLLQYPEAALGDTYTLRCWVDPNRCTQFVCPDECPKDFYPDNTLNLTCYTDCNSPNCEAQCYDWNKFVEVFKCKNPASKCYGKLIECPSECPEAHPEEYETDKACYVDCNSPHCQAKCRYWKPSCDTPGSSCYDPRFVGGDGVVFYFHGKANQAFSLVSDLNFQINGRFIGHRPIGRDRDFTWVQALGMLISNNDKFSLEAITSPTWDPEIDHLRFTYNGEEVILPERFLSMWFSPNTNIMIQRASAKNSVIVTLKDKAEVMINVVPVTKKDDKIHHYKVPKDDCFVHLEVQFKFFNLSFRVDEVLGRTYRPDYENPAKPGVAMPVMGGEDSFRTDSLLSADCKTCIYSPDHVASEVGLPVLLEYATLDCTRSPSGKHGIVCKR